MNPLFFLGFNYFNIPIFTVSLTTLLHPSSYPSGLAAGLYSSSTGKPVDPSEYPARTAKNRPQQQNARCKPCM